MDPLPAAEFATLMAPLGPFEPKPRIAVAVSGGADSLALALLAQRWAMARGGDALGLIVDHGLRAASAGEAAATLQRLAAQGIAAQLLTLTDLMPGRALASRARAARYAALTAACAGGGRLHLLLGHHAADQAETVAMRMLAGSGPYGLAAMPALSETSELRLLRPLLSVAPARLRATLRAAGLGWVEDPSNGNPAAQRARLRAARRDRDGDGPATRAAGTTAAARGRVRARGERQSAVVLGSRAWLAPEGFAVLTPGQIEPAALAGLIRMVAGSEWPVSSQQIALLARSLGPATLGGARLLSAGRLRPGGWLVVREAAAMQEPALARIGAKWDGRFVLTGGVTADGLALGALGEASARLRHMSPLPAAVLATLPALWRNAELVAVPHLHYSTDKLSEGYRITFAPGVAATFPAFWPAAAKISLPTLQPR